MHRALRPLWLLIRMVLAVVDLVGLWPLRFMVFDLPYRALRFSLGGRFWGGSNAWEAHDSGDMWAHAQAEAGSLQAQASLQNLERTTPPAAPAQARRRL